MNDSSLKEIRGDLRTILRISLPLLFFLFCETLTAFCERIFLSYHSVDAVHASLSATYLATIFQSPCVAIGAMGQMFVGLFNGSGELKRIGPCIWQLIWFSLLSMFITLPLSVLACHFYFKDTTIYQAGTEYFDIFAMGNFLFPLCVSLASFYLGRGKTAFVTFLMLTSYALHMLLSWFFIFGISDFLPPLGIKGAALAKCCSMGFLCFSLLGSFLSRDNQKIYYTNQWWLSPSMLWEYMRPGLIRASCYFFAKTWWIGSAYLIIKKGGLYLDVLTVGGTVITFLTFIATGIYRSILTISSNLIGSEKYEEIPKLYRSLLIYILIIGTILVMPLIIFPTSITFFFDSSSKEIFITIFQNISPWVWLYSILLTLQVGLCSLIVSTRDLKLQFYCYLFSCLTSFFPVYFFLYKGGWQPDKLWLIMAIDNLILATIFFVRLRYKKWEKKPLSTLEVQDAPT